VPKYADISRSSSVIVMLWTFMRNRNVIQAYLWLVRICYSSSITEFLIH